MDLPQNLAEPPAEPLKRPPQRPQFLRELREGLCPSDGDPLELLKPQKTAGTPRKEQVNDTSSWGRTEQGVWDVRVARACTHARHANDTHAFPQTTSFVVLKSTLINVPHSTTEIHNVLLFPIQRRCPKAPSNLATQALLWKIRKLEKAVAVCRVCSGVREKISGK